MRSRASLVAISIDCNGKMTREINRILREAITAGQKEITIREPDARHNLARWEVIESYFRRR